LSKSGGREIFLIIVFCSDNILFQTEIRNAFFHSPAKEGFSFFCPHLVGYGTPRNGGCRDFASFCAIARQSLYRHAFNPKNSDSRLLPLLTQKQFLKPLQTLRFNYGKA